MLHARKRKIMAKIDLETRCVSKYIYYIYMEVISKYGIMVVYIYVLLSNPQKYNGYQRFLYI